MSPELCQVERSITSHSEGHCHPPCCENVKAAAGLGSLALSDRVWADPQRRLSVQ
jgi:hypothetical protein